jgi:2-polyprenyl-3-methyl-5-hydroxy-6-metoxy-1,4-benzoquinol methylase
MQGMSFWATIDNVVEKLVSYNPKRIIDLGCGCGYLGHKIKAENKAIKVFGVDGYLPYLQSHENVYLHEYDNLLFADVRDFMKWGASIDFDVVCMFDVIEHFEKDEAIRILKKLKELDCIVVISTPLYYYRQDEINGNPLEKHRCYFTEAELNELGYSTFAKLVYTGIEGRGNEIGTFIHGGEK